jgi:hypothetical protein
MKVTLLPIFQKVLECETKLCEAGYSDELTITDFMLTEDRIQFECVFNYDFMLNADGTVHGNIIYWHIVKDTEDEEQDETVVYETESETVENVLAVITEELLHKFPTLG